MAHKCFSTASEASYALDRLRHDAKHHDDVEEEPARRSFGSLQHADLLLCRLPLLILNAGGRAIVIVIVVVQAADISGKRVLPHMCILDHVLPNCSPRVDALEDLETNHLAFGVHVPRQ